MVFGFGRKKLKLSSSEGLHPDAEQEQTKFDERDLLQVNATIIAGILILLTLASLISPSLVLRDSEETVSTSALSLSIVVRTLTAAAILPFVYSAYLLLDRGPREANIKKARKATKLGLAYLAMAVVVLLEVG